MCIQGWAQVFWISPYILNGWTFWILTWLQVGFSVPSFDTNTKLLINLLILGARKQLYYVVYVVRKECFRLVGCWLRSPEKALIKQRMVYASSKDALKKALGEGIGKEVQANDHGDLAWNSVMEIITRTERNWAVRTGVASMWPSYHSLISKNKHSDLYGRSIVNDIAVFSDLSRSLISLMAQLCLVTAKHSFWENYLFSSCFSFISIEAVDIWVCQVKP